MFQYMFGTWVDISVNKMVVSILCMICNISVLTNYNLTRSCTAIRTVDSG